MWGEGMEGGRQVCPKGCPTAPTRPSIRAARLDGVRPWPHSGWHERTMSDQAHEAGAHPSAAPAHSDGPHRSGNRVEPDLGSLVSPAPQTVALSRTALLYLQRRAGNAAVSQLVQRHTEGAGLSVIGGKETADEALLTETAPEGPAPAETPAPAPAAHAYLDLATAQSVLQTAYGTVHRIVPGNIQFLADHAAGWAKYDELCIAGNVRNTFVTPNRPWQAGDAQARYPLGLNGFAWPPGPHGTSYIVQSSAQSTTTPHEMLHLNTAAGFRDAMGDPLNEGCTQYLALKALSLSGIAAPANPSYPEETELVRKLVALIGGEGLVIDAYFNGGAAIHNLMAAVDIRQGEGTFAQVKQLAAAGDFVGAGTLLGQMAKRGLPMERPVGETAEILV